MTHRQCPVPMNEYHDGDLSPEERQAGEEHLRNCPECAREFAAIRKLRGSLERLSAPDPGESYFAQTEQIVRARTVDRMPAGDTSHAGETTYRLTRSFALLTVAATLLAGAIIVRQSPQVQDLAAQAKTSPVFVVAPIYDLMLDSDDPVVTLEEQRTWASAVISLGPPGFFGRSAGLMDLAMDDR